MQDPRFVPGDGVPLGSMEPPGWHLVIPIWDPWILLSEILSILVDIHSIVYRRDPRWEYETSYTKSCLTSHIGLLKAGIPPVIMEPPGWDSVNPMQDPGFLLAGIPPVLGGNIWLAELTLDTMKLCKFTFHENSCC